MSSESRPAGSASRTPTGRLLAGMLREEWRLHTELFGGRRFAAFPLVVLALAAGGFALLDATGTDRTAVVGGLHALVAFFGLQVGTIGLVGRDAMRNVLGDVTLLVFTGRTLPLTWRYLLGVFLLKDLVYYSVLFLGPVALAYTPLALAVGGAPTRILLLWATLAAAFTLGVGLSLTLVGLAGRHRLALPAALAVLAGTVVFADPVALTPYATYSDLSLATLVTGLGPTVVVAVAGVALFEPVEETGSTRRLFPARAVAARLPDRHGIAGRSLLEVARSSGSVWKVAFSMGVLFVVAAVLLVELAGATRLDPHAGIAFGTLLGLGGFPAYAWLTGFDDPAEYLRYPITIGDVLAGKVLAYLALVVPIGVGYLAVAAVWFPVAQLVVGLVVFPLVAVYVVGLTGYVAGLSPTELLFDTPRFVLFGAATAAVAVPLLVAALAYTAAPPVALAGSVALAALSAGAGVLAGRRAGPRWDDRLRAGE